MSKDSRFPELSRLGFKFDRFIDPPMRALYAEVPTPTREGKTTLWHHPKCSQVKAKMKDTTLGEFLRSGRAECCASKILKTRDSSGHLEVLALASKLEDAACDLRRRRKNVWDENDVELFVNAIERIRVRHLDSWPFYGEEIAEMLEEKASLLAKKNV